MIENENILLSKHAKLLELLQNELSVKRVQHSLAVAQRAHDLAVRFSADENILWTAGLAHDICREQSNEQLYMLAKNSQFSVDEYEKENPILLHGKAAVTYLRKQYPISEIAYFAIAHHSLGHENPTQALKILYLADASSLDREIDFRNKLKEQSLDRQCCIVIEELRNRYTLHAQTESMYQACASVETSISFKN